MTDHFAAFIRDPEFDTAATEHKMSEHHHRHQFTDAIAARAFVRGGEAKVTLVSKKTGTRFTYRIAKSNDGLCHFVSLLVGPDNGKDYRYIGRISRDIFWAGRKEPREGDISANAPSVKGFKWFWENLAKGDLPADQVEVWHEGQCGRCGRALTVPESIASGFGPECIKHVGG